MRHFQIMTASERMPGGCMGRYRRIALVETETTERPAMISKRARGMVRIIQEWRCLNSGLTERCAYRRALVEAEAALEKLRAGE